MELTVRRLGPEDAPLLQRLARESQRFERRPAAQDALQPKDDAEAARFLSRPDHVVLVAEEGEALVGFAMAYLLERRDAARPLLFIYEIGVDAGLRQRGVGRALLTRLRDLARSHGLSGAFVITEASNSAAVSLYRSAGGRRERDDDAVIVFDPEDD